LLNFQSENPSPQISITTAVEPIDQFIKLETDKIRECEIKEENRKLSPEVSFTEEHFNQKDWVYRLSFLQYVESIRSISTLHELRFYFLLMNILKKSLKI